MRRVFDLSDAFGLCDGRALLKADSLADKGIRGDRILLVGGSLCALRRSLALQFHYSQDEPLHLSFVSMELVSKLIVNLQKMPILPVNNLVQLLTLFDVDQFLILEYQGAVLLLEPANVIEKLLVLT